MTLLAIADDPKLPVGPVSLVASPFDFTRVRMFTPIQRLAKLTGGAFVTSLYRALGGAPAPLVSLGFRATALDRYATRPLFLLQNLHDRETIAHSQAVDDYMANMLAYPGRTFGQLYHAFFRVNGLADGRIELGDTRSTSARSPSPCCRWPATPTSSPPSPPCTTWAACCRRRRRCASRAHRAATSECSPAARR